MFLKEKNGRGFIIAGIILILLVYPIVNFVFVKDSVLEQYLPVLMAFFLSLGISLLIAGIIKQKLGVKNKKLGLVFKIIFTIWTIGALSLMGNSNLITNLIIFYLLLLLGFVSSIFSFKQKTVGFGVLVFILSTTMIIYGMIFQILYYFRIFS